MKDEWRAEIVKRIYQHDIPRDELAKEAGITTSYLNMILAGTRNPEKAERELSDAVSRIVSRKQEQGEGANSA